MRKKIYLMTDEGKLKEQTVEYNYNNMLDYINSKSVELGAKSEKWYSQNPEEHNRKILQNERLCHKITLFPRPTKQDLFVRTPEEPILDTYTIFSFEEPMIESLLKILETNKTSIGQFENPQLIAHNIVHFIRNRETDLIEHFNKTNYMSLESLDAIENKKGIIEEYIKQFNFLPYTEKTVELDDMKENIKNGVNLAYDAYTKKFSKEPRIPKEKLEQKLLIQAAVDYKNMETTATNNTKVLRKIL